MSLLSVKGKEKRFKEKETRKQFCTCDRINEGLWEAGQCRLAELTGLPTLKYTLENDLNGH